MQTALGQERQRSADPPPIATPIPSANPIRSRKEWEAARQACVSDPGAFHGNVAAREIHWFDPSLGPFGAWITLDEPEQSWIGYDARTGTTFRAPYNASQRPWERAFNDGDPPFYKWFEGALTNACFNEVDRHVLAGHGDETAFIFEGDRWDQSLAGGRGGPVVSYAVTRKRLLLEVAKAAHALRDLGLQPGDRIALNLPNIPEQLYYTEAAKRLGIIYTPVFGGFSDKTLSDRIEDAAARVIITADGGYRNAQIVPFKESYTDPALDNYLPVTTALDTLRRQLESLRIPEERAESIVRAAADAVQGEVTVERSDVMSGVGRALAALGLADHLSAAEVAGIRTAIARALVDAPQRIERVVVVRHTAQPDLLWRGERDIWSHDLTNAAAATILEAARRAGLKVKTEADLLALPDTDFVRAVWASTTPRPLDAEFPLFFIYTSGSTGKPKGVVHVHGGWVAGIAHTMRIAFDARPGDVMYVVADPGWITGQSYLYSAALSTRVTTVMAEGAPVFPSAGRFASIIERYGVTIFKAGVTFLKTVMQDPQNTEDVHQYDLSSLRVATFCAEPTSPAVQRFGMDHVTPWYINSYWATEHGGIVWTHFYGNGDFPLRADAHTYPLPWVLGDVWVAETGEGGDARHRPATVGEKGEIVITAPYPYLCRTIWGAVDRFRVDGTRVVPEWRGDAERYAATYWSRWRNALAYTQGDFAVKYPDGGFSLHGRSDDVINVSGHRMGTEEIEGAILRDKQVNPDSPVGNVIVVGAPHREKGLTPLAFVKPATGKRITVDDRRRLTELVRQEKGAVAVPSDFIEVSQFPETRSGKYMRRMVRALVEGEDVGDVTTLKNPEAIDELRRVIAAWNERQRVSDEQRIFEHYRYFRIQYFEVRPGARIAAVSVTNPPVNALNERALDELNTVVEHLARRPDVRVVIFTGAGSSSFIAGADIRQLLEEVHTLEQALPLPNNAHLAFRKIERMRKPCIAAINGVALGGGLEFALACHFRVAEPWTSFGQPEIRLNLLPGYGGTQRLPRLLDARDPEHGLRTALEMILGGRSIDADTARSAGLVDEVVTGSVDVLSRSVELARAFIDSGVDNAHRPDSAPRRGALAAAFGERRELLERWEERGGASLDHALADPEIERILRQGKHAGRAPALTRAIAAVREGWEHGLEVGLRNEAELFAHAIVDPTGGKTGIRAFLDKRAAPLPTRPRSLLLADAAERERLIAQGELLPLGAPFFPGFSPIPRYQLAQAVIRDPETGEPAFGDPAGAEREVIVPVERPGPNQALVYVLASEVNFNDIWAITGIPVSQFETHDRDEHVTGSGGVGLIVSMGSELKAEGRLLVGDLVTVYSGQSDLLSPLAGLDPMFADFQIQGYETPDGSHQQFLLVQGPQLFPIPQELTLEAAGSYVLNLGTVVRALFSVLRIEAGRSLFVEGAATGTGLETLKSAARNGLRALGMVSSPEREAFVRREGAAGVINRRDPRFRELFTSVPEGERETAVWEAAGAPLVEAFRKQNDGRLADYVVSHAGETACARSFQLLETGGTFTFYGASSGYYFTFVGKAGRETPDVMLRRAQLRAGESVLVYYGTNTTGGDSLVDPVGLEMIEAARAADARIVVATYTDGQREFVQSLGFGDSVKGVVSLEEIRRREGDDFDWPRTMPRLPLAKDDPAAFREAVRDFQDRTLKPFGAAVGRYLRAADNPRGYPDLVFERAGHDTLGASTSLVKPFTGRVVYAEEMGGRRYAFYAPQVWMRQRRILMPTSAIVGSHLSNAFEVARMNEMVEAGLLEVTTPLVVPWSEMPAAHQAMWENRHAGATYVCNHALPVLGLRTREELFAAWAARRSDAGEPGQRSDHGAGE